ncbi:MAG: phosphatidylglycerol lysyltransferase domain-containing protein [Erysipelotrichaceae bacterium]
MNSLDKDFETLTIDDISLVMKYLKLASYEESNHNIVNMILWMDVYPLWKCYNEHYLLLLGIHEKKLFLYMPLCKPEYFKEAILKAKSIFDFYKMPFILSCFTKEAMDITTEVFPNYHACSVRDSFDYVYECEKLRTFSGKKLQKKRNHLNAFYTLYENHYLYESLNANNALECIVFLDEWKKDNEDEFLNQERIGVKRLLRNWDLLPQKGGIIRIDGEIKAFTIGSLLSSNMCQINVEKGDDEIRGIYQAMVKEFLTREFLDCTYVNREDDMGKENIRSAKEAYHPIFMIEKYRLCECEHIV